MRRLFVLAALLFALPAHAVTIDWVTVGDAGNVADTEVMTCCGDSVGTTGYGAVGYAYRIGKYEVTNAQYAEFLNAVATIDTYGLYGLGMGSGYGGITQDCSSGPCTYSTIAGRENMPVTSVSFYDALRFANWLHNGQPTGAQGGGTTETGAYTITADGIANNSITRNADATIFLTSEDEWYKAAYYDASTLSYNTHPFADGFDGAACEAPPGTANHSANCNFVVLDLTDVGAYTGSPSAYATFDQGGNVWEWNEAIISSPFRGLRGGSYFSPPSSLAASYRPSNAGPTLENNLMSFRVASIRACDDGLDNDGDGRVDFLDDPGCSDPSDPDETSELLPCDDGVDNDGDGLIDWPDDPGCFELIFAEEDPACDDDLDNDGDGLIDWDGGSSGGDPDPQCVDKPWLNREAVYPRRSYPCGLGAELALLLPPLMWLSSRRRRSLR